MSHFLDDIQKTATLARLTIDPRQAKKLAPQLKNILGLVNQMNTVDTDQTKKLEHPLRFSQECRKDEVTEINQRECFQRNASFVEEGLYIVPKIIEDE